MKILFTSMALNIFLVGILIPFVYDNQKLTIERDYFIDKYGEFDRIMVEVSSKEYREDFKCRQFSELAVKKLNEKGIQSEVVVGDNQETKNTPNLKHVWVAVWFNPQSGTFTKNYVAP